MSKESEIIWNINQSENETNICDFHHICDVPQIFVGEQEDAAFKAATFDGNPGALKYLKLELLIQSLFDLIVCVFEISYMSIIPKAWKSYYVLK